MSNAQPIMLLKTKAWLIWSLVTICYALTSFYRSAPATLASDIMQDFAVGGGLLGMMSSAFFYPYALMQIPAGILADRWGSKRTICAFLLLGGAGTVIFALAETVWLATLGRLLVGMGMAMVFVPALRIILAWFSPAQHVSATGLLLSLGTAGMMAATWPLMTFAHIFGWRQSMLCAACITFGMAALVWQAVSNTPQEQGYSAPWKCEAAQKKEQPLGQVLGAILRAPAYWIISIWFFCMYGSFFSFSGLWAGPFLLEGYHLEKNFAGLTLFCLALGSTIGPAIIGWLTSLLNLPKNRLLIFSCVSAMILGAPMVFPDPVVPQQILPVWAFAFGFCCGGFGVIALTLIQDDFPAEIVGTATGMINIYTYLGSACLQMAGGFILGENMAQSACCLFRLYMAMFICAFLASLFTLKHKQSVSECVQSVSINQ